MIVNDYLKKKNLIYGTYEDKIFVSDGFVGYFINKNEFPFNLESLLKGKSTMNVEKILPKNNDCIPAEFTGEMRLIGDGRNVMRFENKDISVWFDSKLLKFFEDYTLHITNHKGIAKVYEGDNLAGIILPVRIEEVMKS